MYINRQYLNMSNEELKRRLLERGVKSDLLQETLEFYAAQRSRIRVAKINRAQQVLYWSALMRPLRAEINSVRAGLKYGDGDEARSEAFEAYLKVMVKLDGMLAPHYTNKGQTPGQLAKEKNASGKGSPITNNGAHWTDWVPQHIKNAIAQAFDDLPYKPKAKRKVPFKRLVPLEQHAKAKARLLKRTIKERNIIDRNNTLNPTEKNADKLKRITRALKIIETLEENEYVPSTWHAVDAQTV